MNYRSMIFIINCLRVFLIFSVMMSNAGWSKSKDVNDKDDNLNNTSNVNNADRHKNSSNRKNASKEIKTKFRINERQRLNQLLNDFFDDDFFQMHSDPFQEMKKMQQKMSKFFNHSKLFDESEFFNSQEGVGPGADKDFEGFFNKWYGGRFGGKVGEITSSEDQKYFYYHLNNSGTKKNGLKVKIENGMVRISGEEEFKKEDKQLDGKEERVHITSSFSRILPVPPNVDADKVEIITNDKEVTLKFPKIDSKDKERDKDNDKGKDSTKESPRSSVIPEDKEQPNSPKQQKLYPLEGDFGNKV